MSEEEEFDEFFAAVRTYTHQTRPESVPATPVAAWTYFVAAVTGTRITVEEVYADTTIEWSTP